ncbi:MAG: hypothetical protein FJ147_05910 [Deltaproteobacteria bacterium]|nr:hypothetical protein [Deltaproteobacteria bacterium]
MTQRILPEIFTDLEPYAGWALTKEAERSRKRQQSTIEEIRAFYTTMLPRMEAVLTHLNQFPLDAMPEKEQRLFDMTLALAEVAPAVELFGKPSEDDVFDVARFVPEHE